MLVPRDNRWTIELQFRLIGGLRRRSFVPSPVRARSIVSYASALLVVNATWQAIAQIDILLIGALLSSAAVGSELVTRGGGVTCEDRSAAARGAAPAGRDEASLSFSISRVESHGLMSVPSAPTCVPLASSYGRCTEERM